MLRNGRILCDQSVNTVDWLPESQIMNFELFTNSNESFAVWLNTLERGLALKSNLEIANYFKGVKVDWVKKKKKMATGLNSN